MPKVFFTVRYTVGMQWVTVKKVWCNFAAHTHTHIMGLLPEKCPMKGVQCNTHALLCLHTTVLHFKKGFFVVDSAYILKLHINRLKDNI